MKNLRWLFLLLVLGASFVRAQSQTLSLDTASLVSQIDTLQFHGIYLGDTFTINVKITNNSNAAFLDSVVLYYRVSYDAGNFTNLNNSIDSPGVTILVPGNINIPAFDSIYLPLHFNFAPPHFRVGPTVVVIWPICSFSGFHFLPDTAYIGINLLDSTAGIIEPSPEDLKILVNQQQLFINSARGDMKYLKIYDAVGELLTEKEFSLSAAIPLDRYAAGVYFVEVTFADNSRKVYKIMNTGVR